MFLQVYLLTSPIAMTPEVIKFFAVALWSSFKFMLGFFMALGFGFNYVESILTTTLGGFLGVLIYLYLWGLIIKLKHKFYPTKSRKGIKVNNRLRWLVNFINKYEIYGIVALTPVFLSVPVGTILASMIEKNKWRIKVYMFAAFVLWGTLLYGIYAWFGIRLDELMYTLF
jgi:hypothetical protein